VCVVTGVTREIVLPAPAEEVWAALTSAERLSAWFGARVEPGLRAGGRATFTWPDGTVRDARVEALDPHRMIVLRWLPFERTPTGVRPRPATMVRFTLVPAEGGTRLTVTEEPSGAGDPGPHAAALLDVAPGPEPAPRPVAGARL